MAPSENRSVVLEPISYQSIEEQLEQLITLSLETKDIPDVAQSDLEADLRKVGTSFRSKDALEARLQKLQGGQKGLQYMGQQRTIPGREYVDNGTGTYVDTSTGLRTSKDHMTLLLEMETRTQHRVVAVGKSQLTYLFAIHEDKLCILRPSLTRDHSRDETKPPKLAYIQVAEIKYSK